MERRCSNAALASLSSARCSCQRPKAKVLAHVSTPARIATHRLITGFIAWLPSDQTAIIAGMKIVFFLALMAIVGALAMAGRAMLQDGRDGAPKSNRMVRALALRVGLSIALFAFILIA